jgi:DNA modification methylase
MMSKVWTPSDVAQLLVAGPMTKSSPQIVTAAVDVLIPYANNARTHSDAQVAQIAASVREFGWTNPILVDGQNGIIAGHGRLAAARKLGLTEVPVILLDHLSDAQKKALIIADNKLASNAGWDDELLRLELGDLQEMGFDATLTGFSTDELEKFLSQVENDFETKPSNGNLADRFLISPFSVLNAREGWWQNRKHAWISLGINSEVGRGEEETKSNNATGGLLIQSWTAHPDFYPQKTKKEQELGIELTTSEFLANHFVAPTNGAYVSGTSIFDPVLCELSYIWFSPVGGLILDPFAGGSVRGIVASKLNRQYIGHELRQEQVNANREQGSVICVDSTTPPAWICGDSRKIDVTCKDVQADFLFSCPPYADLEVYSADPKDLSTLSYSEFKQAYFEIIKKSCSLLKNDRFACFVVGEVRDKKGNYYNFVGDTIQAFEEAGLHYYNEAILITAVGSLPIRAGKQFSASRKLGKTHQNVLVFVKGDGKKAAQACGVVEVNLEAVTESES